METPATYADDHNGLVTRFEIGNTRTQALLKFGRPFGLRASFLKSGILRVCADGERAPNLVFSDGSRILRIAEN